MAENFGISLEHDCVKERGLTASDPNSEQYVYQPGMMACVEEIKFPLMATFMETPVILLGQEDFLKRFQATFDHRAQQLTLIPYPERIKGP